MGALAVAAAVPGVIKGLESLFGGGGGLDAQRKSLIDTAAAQGNVPYLIQWITDQPPHPAASVAYAKQRLAALTGVPAYGGRIATTQPSVYPTAGYLPYRLPSGQLVGIPYSTG